jgi:hypothetical protein
MFSGRRQAQQQRAALVDRLRANASQSSSQLPPDNEVKPDTQAATVPDLGISSSDRSRAEAAEAKRPRLHFQPTLLINNDMSIVSQEGSVEIPHIAEVIVSTLLGSEETDPICILLPSTDGVSQFVAIIAALQCLARDFPATRDEFIERLKPGTRVRALPEDNTYIIGKRHAKYGIDGVFMVTTHPSAAV